MSYQYIKQKRKTAAAIEALIHYSNSVLLLFAQWSFVPFMSSEPLFQSSLWATSSAKNPPQNSGIRRYCLKHCRFWEAPKAPYQSYTFLYIATVVGIVRLM